MVLFKLIRIRETLFSLPLTYVGVLLAAEELPSFSIWFFVTTALVSARTLGMCLNRIFDKNIDAKNPRTAHRLLPSGQVSVSNVVWYSIVFAFVFVSSAFMLNTLCFYLSFLALLLLITYSLVKRFSTMTHLYLGLTEACAPIGGALAVHPEFSLKALLVGLYVLLWIAGFDIVYACQDYTFDRMNKVFSIPAKYGLKKALIISSVLHSAAVVTLFITGIILNANIFYWLCLLAACCFFVWQHTMISADDLTRVKTAFFTMNRNISLTVFSAFILNFIF
jgi:4-hydroxybenzoate polyprenyltransferase